VAGESKKKKKKKKPKMFKKRLRESYHVGEAEVKTWGGSREKKGKKAEGMLKKRKGRVWKDKQGMNGWFETSSTGETKSEGVRSWLWGGGQVAVVTKSVGKKEGATTPQKKGKKKRDWLLSKKSGGAQTDPVRISFVTLGEENEVENSLRWEKIEQRGGRCWVGEGGGAFGEVGKKSSGKGCKVHSFTCGRQACRKAFFGFLL